MDSVNHFSLEGVHFIHLTGTDQERAHIHADVIAKIKPSERKTLPTHPLATKNQKLLERAMASMPLVPTFVQKAVIKTYEEGILRHQRGLDDKYKSRLEVFARHAHISPRELIFALYQPDFLMVLAALAHEKKKAHFLSGMPGCSSAIIRLDEGFTLLRNLDYPAAGHWEKWPTVFYHEPSETDYQNYVSVGSLGIHLAGLTGVNESGIAFSLHAHFSKKFSLKGTPIFFLGQEILESARTLNDAIFICKNFKTIGSWAINLASSKENKSITIELSAGSVHIREMTPHHTVHAHSNGFQCIDFQQDELHFNGSFFEDVKSRKASLEKNLMFATDIPQSLSALASHEDHETGEQRIFGNTVSVVTTIQSLAIDLKARKIHLSNRPETPTPLGPFLSIPWDWKSLLQSVSQPSFTSIPRALSGKELEDFDRALHYYYQAYCSWHVVSEPAEIALGHLIQATEILPHDPHLFMQRGYFELLLSKTEGHRKTALDCFTRAAHEKMSEHHHQVADYFRAACMDMLDLRELSLPIYEKIAQSVTTDQKLRKKALKRLKSPYQTAYCQKIVPDLQFVEPLEYL